MFKNLSLVVLLASSFAACGESLTSPSPPEPPGSPNIHTFVVRNGETDLPVSNAVVKAGGKEGITGSDGIVMFTDLAPNSSVDIEAVGFLVPRATQRNFNDGDLYLLWPDRPGFEGDFSREVAYVSHQDQMYRWMKTQIPVYISPELQEPDIIQAQTAGAALVSAANGTQTFTVTTQPPAEGGGFVTVALDPSLPETVAAVTRYSLGSFPVDGGRSVLQISAVTVAYRKREYAKLFRTAAHEGGHAFGLGHSPKAEGLMNASGSHAFGDSDFSPAEKLAMKLMMVRRYGGFWPDRDRFWEPGASMTFSTGSQRHFVIECHLPFGS